MVPINLTKDKTTIIIGNPGCGKTTELIRLVSEDLKNKIHPSEIAFCSFSVTAVTEAKTRAVAATGLDIKQLTYFRTIHSMCHNLLGLTLEQVMTYFHYQTFAKIHNLTLSDPSAKGQNVSRDDRLMKLIENAALANMPIKDYMAQENIYLWKPEYVQKIADDYAMFKAVKCVYDYTDMLRLAAGMKDLGCPNLKKLYIDEAQDLSTLQWMIVDKMAEFAEEVIIAGDDKQSINEYAGADVDYFLSIDAPVRCLEQSYRIPKTVFKVANQVMKHMHKFRKEGSDWNARDEEGVVQFVSEIPLQELGKGEWLLLSRTNYLMDKLRKELLDRCKEMCIAFTVDNKPPIDIDIFKAIDLFETRTSPAGKTRFDFVLMDASDTPEQRKLKIDLIAMFKKFIPEGTPPRFKYDVTPCFLEYFSKKTWQEAFTKLTPMEKTYVEYLLPHWRSKGMEIFEKAPVRLLTIHGAKGTEADNVVLIGDTTKNISNAMYDRESDTEAKVFYVGVTRAKKKLYIVIRDRNKPNYRARYL